MTDKILFVCTGNRFRSLIAEAYTKKLKNDIEPFSRGTVGKYPVKEVVKDLIQRRGLSEYVELDPEALDQQSIDRADRIIAMKPFHRDYITENFDTQKKIIIWDINDVESSIENEKAFKKEMREIADEIKKLAVTLTYANKQRKS